MSSFLDSTGLSHLIEKIKAAFVSKADTTPATTISIDSTPTANSTNLVTSGGVKAAIPTKVSDLTNDSGFTTNTGTITGITMNGASKGTSGVVNLGTVITSHQDISGKEDKSNKVTSISSSSTDTQYPSAKCVYDNVNSAFAKIPYGVVDSTSTATVFTATVPGITALEDGVCVFLRNGVISSTTGCTLNINGLGAKPIYYNMTLNTRITTAFNVSYTYLFVYNSTVSISGVSGTGAWCAYYGYNSDGNGLYLRTSNSKKTTKTNCGPYRILFSSPDDTQWIPATTSTVANAADLRDVTTEKINPFGRIVYYSSSTAINANAVVSYSATFDQYPFTFGYSFNRTGGTYYILTADAPVYIKCTPQDDDTAIIDPTTPYVQSLPSTEDGKIYIYLGRAYSTQSFELEIHHPVYYYKNGAIRIWTGSSTDEDISRIESVAETALSDLEKKHQRNVKRIEDLEDGFEAIYDDIERIESATPKIELDEVPTSGSNNAVSSGGVYTALSNKQNKLTAGDNIIIDESDTIKVDPDIVSKSTASIPYGIVDSTSTSTLFTVTVPGITADNLEDGTCILVTNNKVTSAAASADPKCWKLNVNGLGALPVFTTQAIATYATTHFGVNYTFMFVYNSSFTATAYSGPGWRICQLFNTNSDTIGYQLRTNSSVRTVTDTARYYKLYFTSANDAQWVPASVNSTNNYTGARTPNQRPIDPFGPIVYTTASTNYTANSNLAATTIWRQYTLNLGYSFGPLGTGLTTNTPVYIKCAPQSNGSAIIDGTTPAVQALPNTEDGKIYIYLGIAYSATNVELDVNHPIYYYKDGAIRIWTNANVGGVSVTELDSQYYPLTNGIIVSHYVSDGYINIDDDVDFKTTDPILYYDSTCSLAFKEKKNIVFSSGTGNGETWFIKCSPNNDEEYYKYYSFGGWVKGADLPQTADGFVYIPIGNSNSSGHLDFVSSEKTYMYFEGKFQEISNVPILSYRESTGNAIELYEGEIVDCGTISNPEFDLIVGGNDIGEYRVFFTCGLSGMSLTFNDVIVNWKEIPQMILDNVYEINILRVDNKFYGIIIMYE